MYFYQCLYSLFPIPISTSFLENFDMVFRFCFKLCIFILYLLQLHQHILPKFLILLKVSILCKVFFFVCREKSFTNVLQIYGGMFVYHFYMLYGDIYFVSVHYPPLNFLGQILEVTSPVTPLFLAVLTAGA